MIDVNKKVRTAIVSVLDETITANGRPVPCWHEQEPIGAPPVYILLNTQTEEDNSNKGAFETIGTILIDVVHHTDGVSYDTVDDVASEVMQILQPTPQSHGLTSPEGLQIWDVRKLSSTPLTLTSDEGNVMRRMLRYEYRVKQL